MKLLFLFSCLCAGCILWAEASPFFFNLNQRSIISPPSIQIRRQPAVIPAAPSFGLGGIISKWFPSISINKQYGTRRPKPSQRPVIEVTTIFEPSEVDKEVESSSTAAPAETIDNFSESSSSSTTSGTLTSVDEIEEIFSTTSSTTEVSVVEKTSTTTAKTTTKTTTTTTTPLPFEEIEPFTESKTTTTTTELPFEETEPSTTSQAPEQVTEGKTSTTSVTTKLPLTTQSKVSTTTEAYKPFTEIKTSTIPSIESESSTKTTTTTESFINEIFTTEQSIPSTSTQVSIPNISYLPSGSDKDETISSLPTTTIKPTTYRPQFVPTTSTTTTTNAPWKETPIDIINTGGYVDPNKQPESYEYLYIRPDISVDDILFNEVSPKARPFGSQSLIGTTAEQELLEQIYKPDDIQQNGEINERPRVTFYSNYFTY